MASFAASSSSDAALRQRTRQGWWGGAVAEVTGPDVVPTFKSPTRLIESTAAADVDDAAVIWVTYPGARRPGWIQIATADHYTDNRQHAGRILKRQRIRARRRAICSIFSFRFNCKSSMQSFKMERETLSKQRQWKYQAHFYFCESIYLNSHIIHNGLFLSRLKVLSKQ